MEWPDSMWGSPPGCPENGLESLWSASFVVTGCRRQQLSLCTYFLCRFLIPPTIMPWNLTVPCITAVSASFLGERQHVTRSSGKGWIQGRGAKIAVCTSDDLAWKHVLCDGLSHTSNKSNQCSQLRQHSTLWGVEEIISSSGCETQE